MASGSTGGGVGTYASMLSRHASPTHRGKQLTHVCSSLGSLLTPYGPRAV